MIIKIPTNSLIIFILCMSISLFADDHIRIPLIKAERQSDGTLLTKHWKQAPSLHLYDPWFQDGPDQFTEIKIINTGMELVVLFLAEDDDIRATGNIHDTWVHKDDCVELFISSPHENPDYSLGIEINAIGTSADYLYKHEGWFNRTWNPTGITIFPRPSRELQLSGKALRHGYSIEISIPWRVIVDTLSLPGIPLELRANFARWDYFSDGRRFSIWTDSRLPTPSAHNPSNFRRLFIDPP